MNINKENIEKINFDKYFIENDLINNRLKVEWDRNCDYFKNCFEEVLYAIDIHYKKYKNRIFDSKFIVRRYSSMIGAHAIGKTKINIGLISQNAMSSTNTTMDHVIGYKTVSKKVVYDFKKNNFNINYMKEKWLKDHLHLWLVIKVTKEEHKLDNIIRGDDDDDDFLDDYKIKLGLNHYKKVSDIYLKKTFKKKYFNS